VTTTSAVGLILGIVLGVLLLIGLLVFFLVYLRRDQTTDECPNEYEIEVESSTRANDSTEYVETEITIFEDDYDNRLSAVGASGDSGGVFMATPEECIC
jgi:hypothetical protein